MWNSNYADGFTRYEMKLGLSHSGKNTGWGCSRIGCWGSYWDIREKRELRIGEDSIRRSYITCTPRQILFIDHIKKNARDGEFNTYRGEGSCIQGCGGEHQRRRPLGRYTSKCKNNIKNDFKEKDRGEWIGLMWLKTGTSGSLLWKRLCIMGLTKLRGMSWTSEKLFASEGLFSKTVH